MHASTERSNRRRVNNDLFRMGQTYHESLPLAFIDEVLRMNNFKPLADGIYCGREGKVTEQVGERTWLTMTWYKMPNTGRYEVVAYVS